MYEHGGNPLVLRYHGKELTWLPCGHPCADLPVTPESRCCNCRGSIKPENRCPLCRGLSNGDTTRESSS